MLVRELMIPKPAVITPHTTMPDALKLMQEKKAHRMPFFLSGTHMMFTHGSLNGRKGLDLFMDSGLAMTVPLIVHEETAKDLGLKRDPAAGAQRVIYPIDSHGVGELTRGKTRALGNVRLGADPYWSSGFIFDALISHQYLYHLRSWTIDFDTMTYYFPSDIKEDVPSQANAKKPTETKKEVVAKDSPNPLKRFVGPYKCEAIKTEVEFTLTGDQLSFTASGNLRGRFTLKKLAENTYEAEDTPQKVTVVFKLRDAKVTEAELTVSGQGPFVFKRG